jgi:hypothetical protein
LKNYYQPTNDSVGFDDIHWSEEMEEAQSQEHPLVTVTRYFSMGIVF